MNTFKTLIHITAFEQNFENSTYEHWITGKRWQLMHNKTNNYRSFDAMNITDEEIRSQPFLGRDYIEDGIPIPDEWFGNDSSAVSISKYLWETDGEHRLLLHPYTAITEKATHLDICLIRRLIQSKQYKQIAKALMKLILERQPNALNVSITLTFRDTGDILASAWWHKEVPYVSYHDEIINKIRHEKVSTWPIPKEINAKSNSSKSTPP